MIGYSILAADWRVLFWQMIGWFFILVMFDDESSEVETATKSQPYFLNITIDPNKNHEVTYGRNCSDIDFDAIR